MSDDPIKVARQAVDTLGEALKDLGIAHARIVELIKAGNDLYAAYSQAKARIVELEQELEMWKDSRISGEWGTPE